MRSIFALIDWMMHLRDDLEERFKIELAPPDEFRDDRLFHLHAKNLKIERGALNDKGILALGWSTPKIPGFGDVDWPRFISTLTDIGYTGPLCVEVEDRAFERDLESRRQSLASLTTCCGRWFEKGTWRTHNPPTRKGAGS